MESERKILRGGKISEVALATGLIVGGFFTVDGVLKTVLNTESGNCHSVIGTEEIGVNSQEFLNRINSGACSYTTKDANNLIYQKELRTGRDALILTGVGYLILKRRDKKDTSSTSA